MRDWPYSLTSREQITVMRCYCASGIVTSERGAEALLFES